MADHSKEALKSYQQQQVIGDKMVEQYQQQIDQQTKQQAQQAISLPTMWLVACLSENGNWSFSC